MNSSDVQQGLPAAGASRPSVLGGTRAAWLMLCASLLLSACGSTRLDPAPVERRDVSPTSRSGNRTANGLASGPTNGSGIASGAEQSSGAQASTPVAEPGTYIVKPGDTLIRIGLDSGQSWRDLARWNSLDNPNLIEVGQVLKIVPPGSVMAENGVSVRPVAPPPKAEARPLDGKVAEGKPADVKPSDAKAADAKAGADARKDDKPVLAEDVIWSWPAAGAVLANFEEPRNKGVTLAGKAGDPVLAAADGVVMYAGTGIRGLGKLIIIKHNSVYLSAYAHNQALLVKEDERVKRGQKIAEMGSTDAERVQLHFEVRRQGKPVDPLKLLPSR